MVQIRASKALVTIIDNRSPDERKEMLKKAVIEFERKKVQGGKRKN